MQVNAYKTKKVLPGDNLLEILSESLPRLEENSVVAVTSKIIAICENRVALDDNEDKKRDQLIKEEAEYYLPRHSHKYNFSITIKHNSFTASAGIDRSNGNGQLIMWPKDPQKAVNDIREHLAEKYHLKHIGVITTDSKIAPLRWGVTGFAIAHSGFKALKSYIGKSDIFGRPMQFEQMNVADSLATAGVAVMGEGGEQTPLALITDVPFVEFQENNPTEEELAALHIDLEDDAFYPMITAVDWLKGKGGKN